MPIQTLTEQCPRIAQPQHVSLPLKDHQLTSIYAMNQLEQSGEINRHHDVSIDNVSVYFREDTDAQARYRANPDYTYMNAEFTINTNIGILSDIVGSGKTYITMGLINHTLTPPNHTRILQSSLFCSVKYKDTNMAIKTNFIIVPHNLVSQWKHAFSYCSLKTYIIARRVDIEYLCSVVNPYVDSGDENLNVGFFKENTIEYYDVIICSATMLDDYYKKFSKAKYSRLIIDEICLLHYHQLYIGMPILYGTLLRHPLVYQL